MSLHPVWGHEAEREALGNAASEKILPAALLLHGSRGIGKQRIAHWLAQLMVCETPRREPCGVCPSCRMALSFEHPDIHYYLPLPRPKGASGDRLTDALEEARLTELDELRTTPLRPSHRDEVRGIYLGAVRSIRSRAHKRPAISHGPIFIIGEAELLVPQEASPEAANALLKLLEEPPATTQFILTSSEPGRLLPTVRSRTVPLRLTPLDLTDITAFLEQEAGVEASLAEWAGRLGQGSPGRALGFLPTGEEEGPLEQLRLRAFDIVSTAIATDSSRTYSLALEFSPAGARGLIDLFGFVEEWLRDLAALAAGAPRALLNQDRLSELEEWLSASQIEAFNITSAFGAVDRARELARRNVNPQLIVSGLVGNLREILQGHSPRGVIA